MAISHNIQSIELLPNNTVLIVYTQQWEQEHIASIGEDILSSFTSLTKGEWVQGADREYIRCHWQQRDIILNFECYSQSVWFEVENETDETSMPLVLKHLTSSIQNVS